MCNLSLLALCILAYSSCRMQLHNYSIMCTMVGTIMSQTLRHQ
jgi:hypothetical protein